MGRKKAKDTLEIAEGLYLKKIRGRDVWHYYFSFDGFQFRASTKTRDQYKATQFSLNAYNNVLARKYAGFCLEKISFRKLSKKYLATLKGQSKERFHKDILKRHFHDFFKGVDDITKVNDGILNDYLIYRREKSNNAVLNQSLNKENVVFNQMMKMAFEYGWITKLVTIKRQSESQSRNRRPHFTRSEYARLLLISRRRLREYADPSLSAKKRGILTTKYWQRFLLHDVIVILANTGMRVDEIKTVSWRDIDWGNRTIKLNSAGKVKSSRLVLIRKSGIYALKRLEKRRCLYLEKQGLVLDMNERIQGLPNGVYVSSMKKSFNDLLNECGFEYRTIKEKHSLTSLRHTYATFRLTAKRGNKASMRGLSKQMGTSQGMLEDHYGHDTLDDYRDQLLG